MNKFLMILLLISVTSLPLAYAHPFTEETNPARFSNVAAGTSEVIVYYSEGIELNFSVLKVLDSNGNQIDNKDTKYFEGDYSLIVTTPPLEDGTYTVTSKVLSKVDGHLVSDAIIFGVGDVVIDESAGASSPAELIFFPEAGARFPGLVGQTIVLGAAIASMFVWGTQRKDLIKDDMSKVQEFFHGKFLSVTGFGLSIVFASNILMLIVQSLRLEASAFDVLETSFGFTWIIRMGITVILLGIWFAMDRMGALSFKKQIPLLILSLALIATTTMLGHGMASEQMPAVVLDYVHNLVSAAWIGGIIFFVFVLLPTFGRLEETKREIMSVLAIPRFSIMIVISVGIVIVSGPTLLWLLESNIGIITESTYGKLIMAKILLAAAMIAMGGYYQFGVMKDAESKIKSKTVKVHKKLSKYLKAEAVLGIALLGVVALLTNGTLPAGEIQTVSAEQINFGLISSEFSDTIRFDVEILPFVTGSNTIWVTVSDVSGKAVVDLDEVKIKVSNPQRGVSPIEIPTEKISQNESGEKFRGDITFGFSGTWQVEIEAKRTESANESVIMNPFVKPRLADLKADVIEYQFPEPGAPLYPVFDGAGNIWISDSSAPRVWKFAIETQEFEKFEFDGKSSITLAVDNDGKIWFTDIPGSQIGFIDPKSQQVSLVELPKLKPLTQDSFPIALAADLNNDIWISIVNKNVLLRYDQETKNFEEFGLPTADSAPFALASDAKGKVWFSQQVSGQIGYIIPETGEIREIKPRTPLSTPETLTFDAQGNIWIAEHQAGGYITKFNPDLETFSKYSVPDSNAFPNGVVFDRYQNAWFAEHTVDKLGVFNPDTKQFIEVPIPTSESWIQFTTSDSNQDIWFVEQKPYKLGKVELTELPNTSTVRIDESEFSLRYSEIASPLIAMGVIATSLFFVKNVYDKRRINSLVDSE
ncbi:MAG: copper resistance protein CopD [Crenarchaeota archaeon]|nr:MAG: copper resistance protein CopD [Thermoproteota archaeon]RDJ34560.1 MAG: copper resistance protein CopD [Thermoproteota archaeon]RDJ35920.1 MAG: copper resistance protein CopD [Thermoproteota archaeon]RDJ38497.1 MAG: copper resistance protein CopD [Thermoproteota archaeon]